MKGSFFQKPFEYRLVVEGETWAQGETLRGSLEARLHGGSDPLPKLRLQLANGELKKVRAKDPAAFEPVHSIALAPKSFGEPVEWSIPTRLDFPITDSGSSLFLLYGREDEPAQSLGQLQLNLVPAPVIQEFIRIFTIRFRFVLKTLKAGKKGSVEAKLTPPAGSALSNLEFAAVKFSFAAEDLNVAYSFQVKTVDATSASSLTFKKAKRETQQDFQKSSYLTPSGRFDDDAFEAGIREALKEAEPKLS